ncbi:MAG: hypothetical protein RLY30_590 [Pseudomonadota bacterium]|jgi:pantothenate kinase type III
MRLLVDCGNTRLKWRLVNGDQMREGSLAWAEVLPQDLAEDWQQAVCDLGVAQDHPRGALCSVASPSLEAKAASALSAFCASAGVFTLQSARQAQLRIGGLEGRLINPYEQPESLGRDRWAAALGLLHDVLKAAQTDPLDPRGHLGLSELLQARSELVLGLVSVGTATVVDRLHCQKTARGWDCQLLPGAILPGLRCSAEALCAAAPALCAGLSAALDRPGLAPGPASTEQALGLGLASSQLGALFWMDQERALDALWVHGGDAAWWQAALAQSPWRDDCPVLHRALIFEGLLAAMSSEFAQ